MRIRYSPRRMVRQYTEHTRAGDVQITEWRRVIEGRAFWFMVAVCPEGTVYGSVPVHPKPDEPAHTLTITRTERLEALIDA